MSDQDNETDKTQPVVIRMVDESQRADAIRQLDGVAAARGGIRSSDITPDGSQHREGWTRIGKIVKETGSDPAVMRKTVEMVGEYIARTDQFAGREDVQTEMVKFLEQQFAISKDWGVRGAIFEAMAGVLPSIDGRASRQLQVTECLDRMVGILGTRTSGGAGELRGVMASRLQEIAESRLQASKIRRVYPETTGVVNGRISELAAKARPVEPKAD